MYVCKYVYVICIDKLGKLSDMITYSGFRAARVHAHVCTMYNVHAMYVRCNAGSRRVLLIWKGGVCQITRASWSRPPHSTLQCVGDVV